MERAAGMMVNYVYRLADVERNHERYFRHHTVVASRAVARLARECPMASQPPASAEA
jgi:malonyl-CoA decarboxylase